MTCVRLKVAPKCACLPCMGSLGKPIPYRNECGCLEINGIDELRNQMMTQQISACSNDTRHPQPVPSNIDPSDTPSCVTNGQYLQQTIIAPTATIGGSQSLLLYNRSLSEESSTFCGYIYYDTQEFWYPNPAGYCGRGKQSTILYGPGSRLQ